MQRSCAQSGNTVKVTYVGTLDDGTVFDKTGDGKFLEFQIGSQQIIPGFEEAVIDMCVGDSKSVTISAAKAYGEHRTEAMTSVNRSALPEGVEPTVGLRLQATTDEGQSMSVVVTEVSPETVTLDANHPLAGKDLSFDITLLDVAA